MEKYYVDGKQISRKEFISGLSPKNQKIEIKKDTLARNKKIIAGGFLGISLALVVYSLNKREEEERLQKPETSSSKLYLGLGLTGVVISFISLVNIE